MNIEKVLTISTAHISDKTNEMLQDEAQLNKMYLSVYDKAEYGYWIYVSDDDISRECIPDDLHGCIELARQNDCAWLCLDCDAEIVEGLRTYDW